MCLMPFGLALMHVHRQHQRCERFTALLLLLPVPCMRCWIVQRSLQLSMRSPPAVALDTLQHSKPRLHVYGLPRGLLGLQVTSACVLVICACTVVPCALHALSPGPCRQLACVHAFSSCKARNPQLPSRLCYARYPHMSLTSAANT